MEDRMEEENEQEFEINNPDVVTKYKTASDIANRALAQVVDECKPGKKLVDICSLGDKLVNDMVAQVYGKGKIEKGSAFPTCLSVNNCVGHFSPLAEDATVLQEGDVVKIELGAHIDGYVAIGAHTVIATQQPTIPTTGRKADVICAAHYAAECAHRLIKPGKKNTDVTEAIQKVAEIFKCQPMEAVLSHQMKRFVIDGNRVIANRSTLDQKVEEFEFQENEVYTVDIVMSTGEGKSKELELKPTVYKRAVDQNYLLKMKASRYVYNEINSRFPTFPFTLRALDEKRAKLGITEMVTHNLLYPYPILFEKQGEFVAQFTFTVLILPSSTLKITGYPTLPFVQSDHKVEDPAINAILALGTKRGKKKNKKKKEKSKGQETQETEKMETN